MNDQKYFKDMSTVNPLELAPINLNNLRRSKCMSLTTVSMSIVWFLDAKLTLSACVQVVKRRPVLRYSVFIIEVSNSLGQLSS